MSDEPAQESDAKKASKEAGIYAYSRLAASMMVLATLAIGARLYDKPEFAFVSAVLLLEESAVALGSLGLADSVFYLIGRNPGHANLVVRQTSFLLLLVAGPVVILTLIVGAGMKHDIALGPALPWLVLTLLIELPCQPAVNQLLAAGRARTASLLYVGFAGFRPVSVLLPPILGLHVSWMPVIMAMLGFGRLIAHLIIVGRIFPMQAGETFRSWMNFSALRSIIFFAFPAGMAVLGGKLNPQIDKYVVQMVRGAEDFVLYSAAAWEVPLITLVPYAIGAVMQSRYVRLYADGKYDELRTLWHQTVRKTALIVLPLTMMLIALARETVIVVAGEKYADAAPLFMIFTCIILQRVASYGAMLQSIGETRSLLVTSSLMLITNFALSYPFTLLFGFTGAAIATAVASIPPLTFTLTRIAKALRTNLAGVMPWRYYFSTLALSAAIAVGTWLLVQTLPFAAGPRLGIGCGAYIVSYFILGRMLRLIGREDTAYLTHWLTLKMLRQK